MKYVAMILGRLYGVFIALVRDNSRGTYATFTPHALAQNPFHPHQTLFLYPVHRPLLTLRTLPTPTTSLIKLNATSNSPIYATIQPYHIFLPVIHHSNLSNKIVLLLQSFITCFFIGLCMSFVLKCLYFVVPACSYKGGLQVNILGPITILTTSIK